jgi:hypothetical protein
MNSVIDSNAVSGIQIGNRNDSIAYCQIRYNGTGFIDKDFDSAWPNMITKNNIENNNIGVEITYGTYDTFICNRICGSTTYDRFITGPIISASQTIIGAFPMPRSLLLFMTGMMIQASA